MLLQTNSYIVPKDKRVQHARLVQRFRQTLTRLGCDHFEAYEQVGANWSPADTTGRFVQLMRFRDRKHQLAVQAAERNDATAQALIKEFCELINFPYQQQQGLFAVGFYHSLLPTLTQRSSQIEQTSAPSQEFPPEDLQASQASQLALQTRAAASSPPARPARPPATQPIPEPEPEPTSESPEPANVDEDLLAVNDLTNELGHTSDGEPAPGSDDLFEEIIPDAISGEGTGEGEASTIDSETADIDALLGEMESEEDPSGANGNPSNGMEQLDLPRVRRRSENH
jgi:hypothetical protein